MKYPINPEALFSTFPVPCAAVDQHIKLASEFQLKVLLCAMRNLSVGIDTEKIAEMLGKSACDVDDALLYWQQAGIFLATSHESSVKEPVPAATPVVKNARPTRADVADRGVEDPTVRFLMQEAQKCLGHSLKSNEASTLLWLYDDQGMEVSVILLLLQYAVNSGQKNISFIEKTALSWIGKGVHTVNDAEKIIADTIRSKTAWSIIEGVFGIEKRRPSDYEYECADLWLNQRNHSKELLKCAYDACIDAKGKLVMKYIAAVLDNWYSQGIKTPADVKRAAETRKAENAQENGFATYDINAFEQMLNSDN